MKVRDLHIGIERDPVIKRALQIFNQSAGTPGIDLGENPYSNVRLLVQDVARSYRASFNRAADSALISAVLLDFCRQGYPTAAEKAAFVERAARDEKLDVNAVAYLVKFHKAGSLTTVQDYLRRVPAQK